jgi:hypothetical protein
MRSDFTIDVMALSNYCINIFRCIDMRFSKHDTSYD